MKRPVLLLLALLCTAAAAPAQSDVFDWEAKPLELSRLNAVRYRGWVPEGVAQVAGTLVLIPGRHGDGRDMAQDPGWREVAADLKFAILACQFADGEKFLYQNDPNGEVSKAIDDAVAKLAQESKHPELAKAPLAFWGHSAGSNVSACYATRNPRRVAALGSSKGTSGPGADFPAAKAEIPMLFALGQNDNPDWLRYSIECIEKGQKKNAPIILALNTKEGHETGGSIALIRTFFRSVIPMRLGTVPAAAGAQKPGFSGFTTTGGGAPATTSAGSLKRISQQAGWLGNPETYDVSAFSAYKGSKTKAMWLPDEATAMAWQSYLK